MGIIEKGKLVAAGRVEDILKGVRAKRAFVIDLLDPGDAGRAKGLLAGQAGVEEVEAIGGVVRFGFQATEPEIAALLERIVREGLRVTGFREELVDLETAFMTLTRGKLA